MAAEPAHYSAMRAASVTLAGPGAVRRIVEQITALLPAPVPIQSECAHLLPQS